MSNNNDNSNEGGDNPHPHLRIFEEALAAIPRQEAPSQLLQTGLPSFPRSDRPNVPHPYVPDSALSGSSVNAGSAPVLSPFLGQLSTTTPQAMADAGRNIHFETANPAGGSFTLRRVTSEDEGSPVSSSTNLHTAGTIHGFPATQPTPQRTLAEPATEGSSPVTQPASRLSIPTGMKGALRAAFMRANKAGKQKFIDKWSRGDYANTAPQPQPDRRPTKQQRRRQQQQQQTAQPMAVVQKPLPIVPASTGFAQQAYDNTLHARESGPAGAGAQRYEPLVFASGINQWLSEQTRRAQASAQVQARAANMDWEIAELRRRIAERVQRSQHREDADMSPKVEDDDDNKNDGTQDHF